MKTISTKEVAAQLEAVFPDLIDWLPTDAVYLLTTVEAVERFMHQYEDASIRYIPSLCECEELSLFFVADVRRGRCRLVDTLPVEERKNLAIGEALATKLRGQGTRHQLNVFVTEDGVYLGDVQTKKTWKAAKGEDNIFFVRM